MNAHDSNSPSGEPLAAEREVGGATDVAVDFLKLLRPGGPWQLSAINPKVNNDIKTVTATTPDQARRFINRYNGNHNLYYAPNPVRIKDKKAAKTEVSAIEFLPGDLDPNEGEAPEAAKARFLAALKSFDPAPMFVVDSGNGVQVLWRLDQPIPLPDPVMVIGADGKTKPASRRKRKPSLTMSNPAPRWRWRSWAASPGRRTSTASCACLAPRTCPPRRRSRRAARRVSRACSRITSLRCAGCKTSRPMPAAQKPIALRTAAPAMPVPATPAARNPTRSASGTSSIDWAAVEKHRGWLKSAADLPADFSVKGKAIVGHAGNLKDLNFDLQHAGTLVKPYQSWSEVSLALAAILKSDGRYSNEQIAAALLCDLECNQHIKNQSNKRRAIERLILRSHAPPPGKVQRADMPNWREQREDGSPLPSLHNARLAITALGIECSYDMFHNKLLFGFKDDTTRHALEQFFGEVTDNGIIALRRMMSDTFGVDFHDKYTRDAIISLAIDHCFDPVVDMLAQAEAGWDGVERLDHMATEYFNADDTPLNRAFVRKTMIAAVARARVPGIKKDEILVLESEEGFNKSTAWRVLAGDENFSDESIIGKNSREVQEQLAEVWVHENADLAGMKKAEVETVKAYASRMVDIARPAYGHFPKKQKRHSIEVGTTNSDSYLQSQTGNRRFWPLRILKAIDIEKLKRDRLQLWGEAAHYQSQGESVVLDPALWAEAGLEQEYRRVTDPWEDVLRNMPEMTTYSYWKDGKQHEGTRTIIHYARDEDRHASGARRCSATNSGCRRRNC
ncbi:hypothetical protein ACVWZK_001379 [Bradyrhizobium sp. GM0.4]